jgi:hypothetical protein
MYIESQGISCNWLSSMQFSEWVRDWTGSAQVYRKSRWVEFWVDNIISKLEMCGFDKICSLWRKLGFVLPTHLSNYCTVWWPNPFHLNWRVFMLKAIACNYDCTQCQNWKLAKLWEDSIHTSRFFISSSCQTRRKVKNLCCPVLAKIWIQAKIDGILYCWLDQWLYYETDMHIRRK